MEATIKFNLPEEHNELLCAIHGSELAVILHEISYNIRRKYLKYGNYSEEENAIVEKVFNDINDEIDFNLDDLVV